MKTTAVRLYGKDDLRLETFELPPIKGDEILAKIVSDSICMSSYKAAKQGADHKRVPNDVADNPVILGHEFCGELVEVGAKWQALFKPGDKFSIQPAINEPGNVYAAPGYSFPYIGGNATYIVIPAIVMEKGCLLPFDGKAFYHGSLAEPMSCIVGGFRVNYHTSAGSYVHEMGIKQGGKMALLAGAGPMGLGAVDYAIHSERRPSLLAVTDIDEARLMRAKALYPPEEAKKHGVELLYLKAPTTDRLKELSPGGYDDVFVYAPVAAVVEQGSAILAYDGCLNFFAGPTDPAFSAKLNFYDVHYNAAHIAGNSGGNTDDMMESLALMAAGVIDPSAMVTHIGGLDAVIGATLNLPSIPGGKKLIYNHISMPLTAIADFAALGEDDPFFAELARLTAQNDGLWNADCERFLLENGRAL
ncbi:MAG: zinc-binding dehydrogenase [Oscillospiraceae bacterium]|jgi:threonine dehydrogenase-like Zn-dependent dehydrogenase|nr:zinc-binding dehydrogenase [Oscillospiraceae bacterium]